MAKKKHSGANTAEVQNATKTLLANIKFMSPDTPICTLAITSSVASEGKSTATVELAKAMVSSGARVLLVEVDMRRPSLASMLHVHAPAGMFAVLAGEVALQDAVVDTPVPNLYLLDVESRIPNPPDIISSNRYRNLVEELRELYDYVLFDTPPVGAFVDAAILSTLVDGVVMVVKQGSTKRREIEHAYGQLKKANANVIGVCSTFCQDADSDYYYYSYYYYRQPKDGAKDSGSKSGKSTPKSGSDSATPGTGDSAPKKERGLLGRRSKKASGDAPAVSVSAPSTAGGPASSPSPAPSGKHSSSSGNVIPLTDKMGRGSTSYGNRPR